MDRNQITIAIEKAKKGIAQYIELMELVSKVDVSKHFEFQKKYNAFYRVRQRPAEWYACYYSLMQESKKLLPLFDQVIDQIKASLGKYEPSFSSKLVATLNPNKPIWDVHILNNTGHIAPSYAANNKIELAKQAYSSIEQCYEEFIKSDDGKLYIQIFDELVPEHKKITELKKIDFILWQLRTKQINQSGRAKTTRLSQATGEKIVPINRKEMKGIENKEVNRPSFKEVYESLQLYGPATCVSTRETKYTVRAGITAGRKTIICCPRTGEVRIH